MIIHKKEKELNPNILNPVITPAPTEKECDYCKGGCAIRDDSATIRAWIEDNVFIIQQVNPETDRTFERRFKIRCCPFCGRNLLKKEYINGGIYK